MPTRTTRASRFRGGGRGWILLAVATGWLFIVGGRYLVPAVLPQVKATFGIGNTGGGIAVTIIWAAYAIAQAPAGLLVDRIGERRLLAGSLLLTAVSVIALGASPLFPVFLIGCALFGLVTGLYGPARGTLLSRLFAGDDGAAIGATLAAGSVGSAVLPFLAGALVTSLGWRAIVVGIAAPLALAAAFAWWAVPTRDGENSASSTAATPSIPELLRAVRTRGVAIAVAAVTLMLFGFQALSTFYVTYLVTSKGLEQSVAAGLFALLFLGGAVAQLVGGSFADAIGDRWVLVATAGIGTASLAAVPFVEGLLPLGILSVLLGVRLGIAPVSNAYIIAVLPASVTGTAWGAIRTVFFLLGAGGSTVVGAMADANRFDEALLLLAALTGIATVLYAALPPRAASRR